MGTGTSPGTPGTTNPGTTAPALPPIPHYYYPSLDEFEVSEVHLTAEGPIGTPSTSLKVLTLSGWKNGASNEFDLPILWIEKFEPYIFKIPQNECPGV